MTKTVTKSGAQRGARSGFKVVKGVDHRTYNGGNEYFAESRITTSKNEGSGVTMNRGQIAGDNNLQQAGTTRRSK